jgi:hypothetical protein
MKGQFMSKRKAGSSARPLGAVSEDSKKSRRALRNLGGSKSDDWNKLLVYQAIQALWTKNSDSQTCDQQLNATLAALAGIGPKDELEGMMAAQLVAAHNATMECYRRAMLGDQTFEGHRESLTQAHRLSRTWATLLEALNRHRGKGQQKVTVEHVHVHAGGQAMVGTIEPARDRSLPGREELHAKQITHAPESPLQSLDQAQDAVPVACDEERPLPNARRKISGGTEGQQECLEARPLYRQGNR